MKKTKYTGKFIGNNGHTYELEVYCFGFIQALFLLTADAIRSGKHYQLYTIKDEHNHIRGVKDILGVSELLYNI